MSSRITIEDVAALARVSIKTVSRVLNDEPNVQISTRQRVTEAINRLNFRPSRVARSLAARRTFILGLMYDNPCAHYVAKLQAGALRACASEGYDLLVLPRSYLNTDTASEIASLYRQSRFDGVILSPPLSDVTALVQRLRQERVPLTLISPGGALVESSSVHTNDQEAARLMTEYLISMGHRDIAFVAGHPDHVAVCTRTAGFLEAMQAAGLSVPDDFVYAGLNSFESGEQAGSCHGNPGPGGWAFLIHNGETIICKKSGRMALTTNNQMELSAAIEAINNFKLISSEKTVSIYTDSKYVIDGINSWIHGWKKNNWMTSAKKPVKNVELWKQLDEYAASLTISWHWVKGHRDRKSVV